MVEIIVFVTNDMSDSPYDRLLHYIDEITKSYDKIRQFESEGCSKEELEKELRHMRDISGEFPSIVTLFFKENPNYVSILGKFIDIFKPPFIQTLNNHLLLFSLPQNADSAWIKLQISMAINYLNGSGWVDGIKGIRTFLK